MSMRVVCRCDVSQVNANVLDKALAELKAKYPNVKFQVKNGNIQFAYDSDRRSWASKVKTDIKNILARCKKEEVQKIKLAYIRAAQKAGFSRVKGITRVGSKIKIRLEE